MLFCVFLLKIAKIPKHIHGAPFMNIHDLITTLLLENSCNCYRNWNKEGLQDMQGHWQSQIGKCNDCLCCQSCPEPAGADTGLAQGEAEWWAAATRGTDSAGSGEDAMVTVTRSQQRPQQCVVRRDPQPAEAMRPGTHSYTH